MAATKLLLLLFSVVLLGLSSADVQQEELTQDNSVLNSASEESEQYPESGPQDPLPEEEEDSLENQGKKPLSKPSDKPRIGGRYKPSGPRGNNAPGGPGSRSLLKGQKDGDQKGKKPRDRPFGPPKKDQKNNFVNNKKRKGSGGQ